MRFYSVTLHGNIECYHTRDVTSLVKYSGLWDIICISHREGGWDYNRICCIKSRNHISMKDTRYDLYENFTHPSTSWNPIANYILWNISFMDVVSWCNNHLPLTSYLVPNSAKYTVRFCTNDYWTFDRRILAKDHQFLHMMEGHIAENGHGATWTH